MRRWRGRILPSLGLILVAAGCASSRPEAGPPGSPAGAAADAGRPAHTEADVRFMQRMIAHHAQALAMAELVPARTATEAIHLLAERIEVSQRDEIALMQQWLRERGEVAPDAGEAGHAHGEGGAAPLPGMLGPQDLARLEEARGAEFDRLFLELMIRHHEGALAMVAELFAAPGAGQDSQVFRLAMDVDADQRAEIRRMQAMLDGLQGREGAK